MPVDHTEKGFEQAIQAHLQPNGYTMGNPAQFNRRLALALDRVVLASFLKDTQSEEWNRLTDTRRKGLDREHNLALLKKHIDESSDLGASIEELSQVLPSLPVTTVRSLLRTLCRRGETHLRGKSRAARSFSGAE